MKAKLTFLIIFIAGLSNAYAKKNCTNMPRGKWMPENEFKEFIKKQGYKIRKLKQPGTCYEIYGKDKDDREVEIYFNPVDGSIKKLKYEN